MNATDDRDLWVRWKDHRDPAARDKLVLRHMRLVKYVAGRMAIHCPPAIEMDDLIGWGLLGLIESVERFDHAHATRFSTYATIRIRGAILDQIRSFDWAPRSLRAMARRIGETRDRLRQERGREPSAGDIAEALGTTEDHVDDTMGQLQTAHVLSLQDYLNVEHAESGSRLHATGDPRTLGPDEAVLDKERQERIVQAILKLPEQQQKVLHLYYYEELTLKEIGAVLNVTESRVSQIHGAAMKALRKALQRGD